MRVSRKHPATYVVKKGAFPQGPYRSETPWEVFLAAGLARRLKNKIGKESIRYVAKMAGLSPQTLVNILHGETWPDLLTISRLEESLGAKLWGNEHRKGPVWIPGHLYIPRGFDEPSREELLDIFEANFTPWEIQALGLPRRGRDEQNTSR